MHDLVKLSIDAYGGIDQWRKIREVSAAFTVSGVGFKQRGPVGEAFAALPMRVTVNTREQNAIIEPFVSHVQKGIYQPRRTVVASFDDTLLEELNNPRDSLKAMALGTPWTAPQILYFIGYSLWMYLTLPFSFLMDGVRCKET